MSGEFTDSGDGNAQAVALLADRRRLKFLRTIYEADAEQDVEALVDDVGVDDDRAAELYELHHRHLPMLASEDWIRFDAEREVVEPADPESLHEALSEAVNELTELDDVVEQSMDDSDRDE